MDRIVAARVFVTIVDRGSMVEAGKALDMSRSMVTRYLAEIEDWADTRLLHRSTRRLSMTPGGEHVLEQCRQLLATAEKLANVPNGSEREPSGLVRFSCAHFVAVELLSDTYVQGFQERYPQVVLDFHISNQTVDLVADRIDLAIRITNDLDPNLISRKFGICHSTICASPEYLGRVPQPRKPADLATLNCLTYSCFANRLWHFQQQDSHSSVAVEGNFSANESACCFTTHWQDAAYP